jgi:hypothetical protein
MVARARDRSNARRNALRSSNRKAKAAEASSSVAPYGSPHQALKRKEDGELSDDSEHSRASSSKRLASDLRRVGFHGGAPSGPWHPPSGPWHPPSDQGSQGPPNMY